MTEKLAYSVSETAEVLGVAPNTIYDMVAKHQIPHHKLGSRIIIPVPALIKWLETAADNVRIPKPALAKPADTKPTFNPNVPSSPNPPKTLHKGYWQSVPGCGGRKKKRG
jgi:excisionase family DNA binding protein